MLSGAGVSSEHAVLSWTGDGTWTLRDLASRNGTFIDGKQVDPGDHVPIHTGTKMAFGDPADEWVVDDDGPPDLMAVAIIDGATRASKNGMLALPEEASPEAQVYQDPTGQWVSESSDGEAAPVQDQGVVQTGGVIWRVLLPQTAEALHDYMKRHRSSSPYLFPGNTSTGHMSIHNLEKTLRRMCARLGVRPFTPHQLRHLYATTMLKGGAKLEVVSRILGHTGVGVTADIYRHVATEELHEEHARFAPLNGGMALLEG